MADAVIGALSSVGEDVETLALLTAREARPTFLRKAAFSVRALRRAWNARSANTRVVIILPAFALLGAICQWIAARRATRAVVIFHGAEIWAAGPLTRVAWRVLPIDLITVSSFSAGALSLVGAARVVEPVTSVAMYELLTASRPVPALADAGSRAVRVLTVFRLDDARAKGVEVLLAACDQFCSTVGEIQLTIAGAGIPPAWLATEAEGRPWVSIASGVSDTALAGLYLDTDLFVLATRLRRGRTTSSGEGFGIALAEAALAGCVVVGPAGGGSRSAMINGATGLTPADESASALIDVLRWCYANPSAAQRLAANARAWATEMFSQVSFERRLALALGSSEPFVSGLVVGVSPDRRA